jgi:ElaB/YqjD/DUF883 family membrane-anchored ribosome-binding protein
MSNRDPRYGDSGHGDPFAAPTTGLRGDPTTGSQADEMKNTGQQAMDQAADKGQQVMDQASQKGEQARQKLDEAAGMAQERADQGMGKAAEGLDQASEMLRQRGEQQGGAMGSVATKAADTMDSASGYLRDKDTNQLMDDLENLIRRKPTESLLVAAGIGFVLSKIFK